MRFEPLNYNNVKGVAILDKRCFSGEAWSENLFRAEIENVSKFYSVCLENEVVVGFGGYDKVLNEGYITNIAVDEKHRRKGIAKKILKNMIDSGKERGIEAFTLEVRISNIGARKLYESLGFELAGIRKRFYPDKEDACIYWLYIRNIEKDN